METWAKIRDQYLKKERTPRKESCFLPVNCIQAVENLSQNTRLRTSAPQVLDHVKDYRIHSRSFMHQGKSHKDIKTKGIQTMGTFRSR